MPRFLDRSDLIEALALLIAATTNLRAQSARIGADFPGSGGGARTRDLTIMSRAL
jgi:hypothetical protein